MQDVAEALTPAGISRGDRVGMALPNGLANVVTFLAAPVLTVEMDANGKVSLAGVSSRKSTAVPAVTDTALILHTSGSTGRPKRGPLSHANLAISSGNVARSYALSKDDVSL